MSQVYHYVLSVYSRDSYKEVFAKDSGTNPLTGTMNDIVDHIKREYQPGVKVIVRDNVTYSVLARTDEDLGMIVNGGGIYDMQTLGML